MQIKNWKRHIFTNKSFSKFVIVPRYSGNGPTILQLLKISVFRLVKFLRGGKVAWEPYKSLILKSDNLVKRAMPKGIGPSKPLA
jgi:hypothetical protein